MNTLSEEQLRDIAYSLDRVKGNVEYWRLLIPLLPKNTYPYNKVDVEKIAFVGITGKGSPSLEILLDFQRKRMELSYFKNMLRIIECQGALDCFNGPTMPVIHTQPVSVTVNVNERLELQCIANCVPEPPDYQWFYYAPNGTSVIPLKGKKSWRLVIDKIAMGNTGHYCCRVQNRRLKEDKYAVFSDYATVMVKDNTHTELEISRRYIPVQEETDRGHETLKSEPPASIPDVSDDVEVTRPEQSTGTVSPHELIRILIQPESQTVRLKRAEETITLRCQAKSLRGQQLEYKWYYLRGNENPAALNKGSKTVKSTEPHIDIALKLSNKQERRYFCEVSVAGDPEHFVASEVAVIRLQSVWFVEQPEKKYIAMTGKELKLTCRVETAPGVTVKYQWFQCQQDGMGKQPTSCYDNVMVLPAIISSQGYYLCSVMVPSSESIHSDVAQVEVVNSTDITIKDGDQPPSDRYVELNEKLVIKVMATCKNFPVNYQWYHNFEILPDCTNSTLILDAIGVHHIGSYHCEVSSDYSTMSVISETCRVHWRGSNPSLPTINRQQIDAEEVLMVDNRIYATEKMALLIGNSSYKGKPLKCSKNDVEAVTNKLRQLNFKTVSLVDLTLSQMAKAVDYFCSLLDHGMYAMLYYSGHGLELNKTTYLMPIDADEPVKIDQCMNADDVAAKMQARKAKVFMILDCCRINLSTDDARSVQPLSIVPPSINHARAFSNICQLFACSPSFEALENKDGCHSYMTEAFLQEVDKAESVMQALKLSSNKKYDNQKFPGRVAPRSQLVLQMDVADKISFHDPILNEHELKEKELLLNLPNTCCLEFTNPKLKNACGQVELRFSAKFSNVMIVHVVCNADLQPEVVVLGEKAELECGIQKENDKIITSFKIADLLDVVQNKNSKLQISFQMPEDSSAKDTLDYRIPANLIKPLFHHH